MKPLWISGMALLGVFAFACGGGDDVANGPGANGVDTTIGAPCADDTACGPSSHCTMAGVCGRECDSNEDCGGATCDEVGRCGGGFGTQTQTGTNGGGAGDGCPDISVAFEPLIPTVVMLVDRSGSMHDDFNGGTRWDVVREALLEPTGGVLKQLENEVRFGLALYTSVGPPEQERPPSQCPELIEVAPALANHGGIQTVYEGAELIFNGNDFIGDTPTPDSVRAVATQLAALDVTGPKVIMLVTDGQPDSCECPNPNCTVNDNQIRQEDLNQTTVDAVAAAHTDGINTYVIAMATQTDLLNHLQVVANVGQGFDPGDATERYFSPNDQTALINNFNEIIAGERSCVLDIDGTIDPEEACSGEVTLNGESLECEGENGWEVLPGGEQIELKGTACETIKVGVHTVAGEFPCDAIVVQ